MNDEGYIYLADTYCSERCVIEAMIEAGAAAPAARDMTLAILAPQLNVDMSDERTYDSDEFPKEAYRLDEFDREVVCATCSWIMKRGSDDEGEG